MFNKKPNDSNNLPIEPTIVKNSVDVVSAAPSIISSDTKVFGNVVSSGEVQIEGSVHGDVRASDLVIGVDSTVKGEVVAENVHVRGSVDGTVRARSAVLVGGCRVVGDIINQSLEIEKGSHFEGASRHSDDPLATASTKLSLGNSNNKDNKSTFTSVDMTKEVKKEAALDK